MRLNFQENKPKTTVKYVEKKDYTIIFMIGAIIFILIAFLIGLNIYKGSKCNGIENKFLDYAYEYAESNNLLNIDEGEFIYVDIQDVYDSGYSELLNGNVCSGTVKFTMADGKIIKTFNISDCSYCSTNKRYGSWKESNTFVNSKLVDVDVKYNYYNAETFYTKWTDWYPSSYISTSVDEQYGIKLPNDIKYFPSIPQTSEVLKYDIEYKTFYSYRDKTWKWYRNNNNQYTNEWYSVKPDGYAYKDEDTLRYTEWSDWSLNYPTEVDYRHIKSATGYRWYYVDENKNRHYWNGGAYSVNKPSDDYPSYDEAAKMYSYRDETWRWYNGDKRGYYYNYSTTKPNGYNYKDPLISDYTKWSSWSSEIPNSYDYRTIDTDIYYRYRAFYRDINFLVLDDYISKDEFENAVGKSLEDFKLDNTKKISYKYTYLYK